MHPRVAFVLVWGRARQGATPAEAQGDCLIAWRDMCMAAWPRMAAMCAVLCSWSAVATYLLSAVSRRLSSVAVHVAILRVVASSSRRGYCSCCAQRRGLLFVPLRHGQSVMSESESTTSGVTP